MSISSCSTQSLLRPINYQTKEICHNINHFSSEYFNMVNTCLTLSKENIKTYISVSDSIKEGKEILKEKITNLILTIIKSHPDIEEYISVVFNHLPNFKIFAASKKDFQGRIYSCYIDQISKTMFIAVDTETYDLLDTIRHEFRHAFWIVVQNHLLPSSYPSTNCWLPTDSKDKIIDYLELGDTKMRQIWSFMKLREEGKLDKPELEVLAYLENLIIEKSEKYYFSFNIILDENIAYKRGTKMNVPSQEMNEIVSVTLINDKLPGKSSVLVKPDDVIIGLYYSIFTSIKICEQNYKLNQIPYEREAYLYGSVPIDVIEIIYNELYNYTCSISKNIAFTQSSLVTPSNMFTKIHENILENREITIKNPQWVFDNFTAKNMIASAQYFVDNKLVSYYPLCKNALSNLIKKRLYLNDAYTYFAKISIIERDFKTACLMFNKLWKIKDKSEFSLETHKDYVYALYKEKQYKKSKKLGKELVSIIDAINSQLDKNTKNTFSITKNTILSIIKNIDDLNKSLIISNEKERAINIEDSTPNTSILTYFSGIFIGIFALLGSTYAVFKKCFQKPYKVNNANFIPVTNKRKRRKSNKIIA